MEVVATRYFQDMFQTSEPNLEDIESILNTIPTTITPEQKFALCKSFTQEEIFGVIKNMHPTTALGADGIQAVFFFKSTGI